MLALVFYFILGSIPNGAGPMVADVHFLARYVVATPGRTTQLRQLR